MPGLIHEGKQRGNLFWIGQVGLRKKDGDAQRANLGGGTGSLHIRTTIVKHDCITFARQRQDKSLSETMGRASDKSKGLIRHRRIVKRKAEFRNDKKKRATGLLVPASLLPL